MKETDQYKQCQATPRSTLEQEFMSHNTPLREREHWARNEIERLREDLRILQRERDDWQDFCAASRKDHQADLTHYRSVMEQVVEAFESCIYSIEEALTTMRGTLKEE